MNKLRNRKRPDMLNSVRESVPKMNKDEEEQILFKITRRKHKKTAKLRTINN